jgi:hypothetical protein
MSGWVSMGHGGVTASMAPRRMCNAIERVAGSAPSTRCWDRCRRASAELCNGARLGNLTSTAFGQFRRWEGVRKLSGGVIRAQHQPSTSPAPAQPWGRSVALPRLKCTETVLGVSCARWTRLSLPQTRCLSRWPSAESEVPRIDVLGTVKSACDCICTRKWNHSAGYKGR